LRFVPCLIAAAAIVAAAVLSLSSAPGASAGRHAAKAPTWARATAFRRPAFKPARVVDVTTQAAFAAAWNAIRPGDEILVHGVTFTGEVAMNDKQLDGWAEVHFDSATRFAGVPSGNFPAVWVNADRHVRFYGGKITNPHGSAGILIYDSADVTWWGFTIDRTGGTGLMVQGIRSTNRRLDLKGSISRWGLDAALDPHSEPGTGLHGALLADANFGVTDSRFALDLHDGAAGAGVEAGGSRSSDLFERNRLYLTCSNLTMRAVSQIAANCLQFWGENVIGNRVGYLAASRLQGRPYDANGMYPNQSLATDVVEYGRASGTNLSPYLGRTETGIPAARRWDRRDGTVFRNVHPLN
jgi:hypothetical protein